MSQHPTGQRPGGKPIRPASCPLCQQFDKNRRQGAVSSRVSRSSASIGQPFLTSLGLPSLGGYPASACGGSLKRMVLMSLRMVLISLSTRSNLSFMSFSRRLNRSSMRSKRSSMCSNRSSTRLNLSLMTFRLASILPSKSRHASDRWPGGSASPRRLLPCPRYRQSPTAGPSRPLP